MLLQDAVRFVVFSVVVSCLTAEPVSLTPENFDSVLDGSKNVFVKFYAPWCGHCKAMIPAYEEVSKAFAKEPSVVIADVDADAHRELGSRFGVNGFPTLKFFKKGSTVGEDYNGGREASDIIEYINQQAGTRARVNKPATAVTVLTPSNFDSIVKDTTKDVFVEFFAPWCGHCKNLAPIWEQLAAAFKTEKDVVIASVDADQYRELGSAYDVSGFPTLIYFSKSNKAGESYNGGRDLNDLLSHVNSQAGTHRLDNGRYDSSVGRSAELDALAKKFVNGDGDKESLTTEAEQVAQSLGEHAQWYAKFMKAAIKKGDDWFAKEKTRVDGLLEGGAMSAEKIDEFTVRKNVLQAFE